MRCRPPHAPNTFYHVTLRGNRQQALFHDTRDRYCWQRLLATAMARYGARLHLYCWMSNHIHMVLECGETPVFKTLHLAAGAYARTFNSKYAHVGHLFQDRYGSRLIESDSYLLQLIRYIHLNPVAAGITAAAADYRWSSCRWYASPHSPPWLTTTFILTLFSDDAVAARTRMIAFTNSADHATEETITPSDEASPQFAGGVTRTLADGPTNLHQLTVLACQRFEVDTKMLFGESRQRWVTKPRAWIAWCAQRRGIATLNEVARFFDRDPSALGRSVRLYEAEFDRSGE